MGSTLSSRTIDELTPLHLACMRSVEYLISNCNFVYPRNPYQGSMRTRFNFSVRSTSNWKLKVLVFEESGKLGYPSKTSRSKGESHQQTQPTFGVDAGI